MDFIDREKAKHHAKENVENMYDQHYVQNQGADQYDPYVLPLSPLPIQSIHFQNTEHKLTISLNSNQYSAPDSLNNY